jgi:FMN phosphatase YigB (HAD superfamily)
MQGRKTSEEISRWLAEELDHPYDDIFNTLVEDSKNIDLSDSILDGLRRLKDRYVLILVTDNMDSFERWTVPANREYFSIFDNIFNSAQSGLFKKDENCRIFRDYISQYSAEAGNCILIDDSSNNRNAFGEHV